MFENYLLAIHTEGDDRPDTRKRATFLYCLGTEAQRVFYTIPNTSTIYASALTALRVHFVNVIAERHKFHQREQRHDENIV